VQMYGLFGSDSITVSGAGSNLLVAVTQTTGFSLSEAMSASSDISISQLLQG